MKPLHQRPLDDSKARIASASRSVRLTRNVGILVIASIAIALVVAAVALAWSYTGSIAWSVLAFAVGLLLAILWALVLVNLWCSTLRRVSNDYFATVKSQT